MNKTGRKIGTKNKAKSTRQQDSYLVYLGWYAKSTGKTKHNSLDNYEADQSKLIWFKESGSGATYNGTFLRGAYTRDEYEKELKKLKRTKKKVIDEETGEEKIVRKYPNNLAKSIVAAQRTVAGDKVRKLKSQFNRLAKLEQLSEKQYFGETLTDREQEFYDTMSAAEYEALENFDSPAAFNDIDWSSSTERQKYFFDVFYAMYNQDSDRARAAFNEYYGYVK